MQTALFQSMQPDLASLERYTSLKAKLASFLRRQMQQMEKVEQAEDLKDALEDLFAALAADCFRLAVLGQFKRGKSSLMNAILGKALLPTGVLPLTSVVTTIKYGPKAQAIIEKEGLLLPKQIEFSQLAEYITEKGNPSNEQKVRRAEIELPLPFLRRGVEFVDTPGVGSSIAANTAATREFLPKCDAALFVTGADAPLNEAELDFLCEVGEAAPQIFFIINKIDAISPSERQEVAEFCAAAVKKRLGRDLPIFAVSARQGLLAKDEGSEEEYAQSGIKALEEDLAKFLAKRRSKVMLIKLSKKAQDIWQQFLALGVAEDDGLGLELQSFEKILRGEIDLPQKSIILPQAPALSEHLVHTISEDGWLGEAAWHTTGCPICQHLSDTCFAFFRQWQYALEKDAAARQEFVSGGGYCQMHTWQFVNILSPYAASLIYSDLAQNVVLQMKKKLSDGEKDIANLVIDKEHCSICAMLEEEQAKCLKELSESLLQEAGRVRYFASQGICLNHLHKLLPLISDSSFSKALIEHAASYLAQAVEDMQTFALKHEAIAHKRENIEEKDAYYRAVTRLAGSAKQSL